MFQVEPIKNLKRPTEQKLLHILRLLGYASRILYPEKRDYHLAVRWQTLLRRKGSPIPAVDLIIAAQAYNRDLTLITRDKHFELLKREVAPDLKLILEGE